MFRKVVQVVVASLAASAILVPTAIAKPPKSEITNTDIGEVCFPDDQCVKVQSVRGALFGVRNERNGDSKGEWITGVYDANSKLVGKVKLGGEVIVISPETYARRDAGQKTFTIHRLDGSSKPVKTPFIEIKAKAVRIGWDNWFSPGFTAVGMSERPETVVASLHDMTRVAGVSGGIARDGTVSAPLKDVESVFDYGDYRIFAHTDGKSYTIADDKFRPLSPRLTNLALFTTAFDDSMTNIRSRLGYDSRKAVFAIKTQPPNSDRTIYTLIPRRKGDQMPDGMVGLAPILTNYGAGWECEADLGPSCRRDIRAWVAIWATDDGQPLVSIEDPLLNRLSSDRFRSVHWNPYEATFIAAVAETLQGDFRILPYEVLVTGDMRMSIMPDSYATLEQANAAIRSMQDARYAELWQSILADQQLERQRYAAWQATRDEEDRQQAERAAGEAKEIADAQTLIATDDADVICDAYWKAEAFFARNNLLEACNRLRPPPKAVSRGFWGDLSAGLAAYNSAVASGAIGSGSGYSGSAPSSGSAGSGDFNRSMQSIDNALRVISDPNWNGAAAAAQN